MAIKFGRNYELNIQTKSGDILTVTLPLTVQFDIQRNALSSASVANFKIYNLEPSHRAAVQKNLNDTGSLRTISFKAGYGPNNLPECFIGAISQCYSYKQSRVDIVTEIQCYDGGFAFSNAPTIAIPPFPSGTKLKDTVGPILNSLPGNDNGQIIKIGAIGNALQGELSRSNSFAAHPWEVLKNLNPNCQASSGAFVDLGKLYVLQDNECIPANGITTIDADNGLLETPIWEETIIHFPMLMETRILVAQRLTLISTTNPTLNHDYKVISLGHRGTISEAVCEDAITNVGLFAPLNVVELTDVTS